MNPSPTTTLSYLRHLDGRCGANCRWCQRLIQGLIDSRYKDPVPVADKVNHSAGEEGTTHKEIGDA